MFSNLGIRPVADAAGAYGARRSRAAGAIVIPVLLLAIVPRMRAGEPAPAVAVDFNRDIRPILSKHCYSCHGFDEKARRAGLRLDNFEGATRPSDTGLAAIVPSNADESELIRRVAGSELAERMPPAKSGKPLAPAQVELLRRWIDNGAGYARHWAFVRPVSPPLPEVRRATWPRNPIDRFVLKRLETEHVDPAPEADPSRLLRRVALDLIGLPPTPAELERFLHARALDPDAAYEAEVDRLLNSPHYGERLAIDWMDAARYADTNGYFGDRSRQAWPWRDWVIQAFNSNMPFDRFTVEQLAGDLLPNATREQRIATGFHRNSMANNETGIIDEEYRVEAVADRVDTTATVWLGLSLGCAQCHDHKFDPLSQHEYYRFFACFNNSVEGGLVTKDSPPPIVEVPTDDQAIELQALRERLDEDEREFAALTPSLDSDIAAWATTAATRLSSPPQDFLLDCDFDAPLGDTRVIGTTLNFEPGVRGNAGKFDATQHLEQSTNFSADGPWTISIWLKPTGPLGCLWSMIEPNDRRRGLEAVWQKGRMRIHLVHRWGVDEISVTTRDAVSSGEWHHALVSYDGGRKASGLRVALDGHVVPVNILRDSLTGSLRCDEPLRIGRRDSGLGFYGLLDQFRLLSRVAGDDEAARWTEHERLLGVLSKNEKERSESDRTFLREHYLVYHARPELLSAYRRMTQSRLAESTARARIPTALVMQDRAEPRPTHVLVRGRYDQRGAEVFPGVPSALAPLPEGAPPNRLGLARWLVSPVHPLTSRVVVNRLWQMCFGEGLVRTPNDFGAQGEPPTHPELLDDLAVRLIESGWDLKQTMRLIVTSATYRQSSSASTAALQRDPDNRLLARGPRFRLPAELVRDQALAVAGLLARKIGGPSVKPYQPDGLWEAVSYNEEETYVPDTNDGLWRRSLYTYWKRQAPPPALMTFDANTREKCLVRRSRTNTPLQAFVLLNDPTWVEAARALAELTAESGGNDEARLRAMFLRAVSRIPEPHELQLLADLLARERQLFSADPEAAGRVIAIGATPPRRTITAGELAAWTLVAQTILNLDEVVTRR